MKVSHFGGMIDCETVETLEQVLNMRYGSGVNEFWISGEEENPCLAVLVNNDYANLTYFPDDGHPGFQSIGMETGLDQHEISIFYTNTPEEEIEVNNDTVIPFSKALEAAKEFFTSTGMPKSIEWLEL